MATPVQVDRTYKWNVLETIYLSTIQLSDSIESGTGNWTLVDGGSGTPTDSTDYARTGTHSIKIDAARRNEAQIEIAMNAGDHKRISVWRKRVSLVGVGGETIRRNTLSGAFTVTQFGASVWTSGLADTPYWERDGYDVICTASGTLRVRLVANYNDDNPGCSGTVYFDDFLIENLGPVLKWNVLAEVPVSSRTFKWNVSQEIKVDRTFLWQTGVYPVQKDTTLRWQILPGTQRIELALSGQSGRPVAYTFAYEKVSKVGLLQGDVTDEVLAASFDLNNDREIVRGAQFVFVPGATGINFASDFIRAYMMLLVDGSTYAKIPIGQFSLNIPQNTYKRTHKEQAVQAAGMTVVLEQTGPTSPYYVAAGANVISTVRSICTNLGLNHRFVNSTKVTASANTWPNGVESWLDIVNDLLSGIDYYTCWDEDDGYITSRPTDDLAYRDPDISYTDSAWILNDDIAEQIDETLPANQVVMIMRNPGLAALVSVKTNADPNSPISTVTLGRTIQARMESNLAVDQTTLDAIAARYLHDQQDRYMKATITTPIDPRRTAREVYRVTVSDAGYDATLWRVRNWKFDAVTGGKMTHEISRTLPLVVT